MILRPSPVNTDRFTRTDTREFVAEISDLGKGWNFGRVYDDACDEGMTLVSAKTGKGIVMAVCHVERNEDDLLWWDLEPALPAERGLATVRLYND